MNIGPTIRTLRKAQNITLDALALKTSLNKGYLSRLERGIKTPSVQTLARLSRVFDVPIATLVDGSSELSQIRLTRRAQMPVMPHDISPAPPSTTVGKGRSIMTYMITPGADFGIFKGLPEPPGDGLLLILSGCVEVRFADRSYVLDAGDTIIFPRHLEHALRSIGPAVATALMVFSTTR